MRERRFPKFAIPDGKSELEYNKTFIEELRSQVNMLMANLESVPVSRSTAGQNYSRVIQKMQANPLALLDHKAEDEESLEIYSISVRKFIILCKS